MCRCAPRCRAPSLQCSGFTTVLWLRCIALRLQCIGRGEFVGTSFAEGGARAAAAAGRCKQTRTHCGYLPVLERELERAPWDAPNTCTCTRHRSRVEHLHAARLACLQATLPRRRCIPAMRHRAAGLDAVPTVNAVGRPQLRQCEPRPAPPGCRF